MLVLFAVAGCGLKWGEDPPENQPVNVVAQDLDCLANSRSFLKRYGAGVTTEKEVSQFFSCGRKAIDSFVRFTRGAHPDFYSLGELEGFVRKYVPRADDLSSNWFTQVGHLKMLFLGGTPRKFRRSELVQLKKMLQHIERSMIRLLSVKSLWTGTSDSKSFRLSESLQLARVEIEWWAQRLSTGGSRISYSQLVAMLDFVLPADASVNPELLQFSGRDWGKLFVEYHRSFFETRAGQIGGADWETLLLECWDWFALTRHYHWELKSQNLFFGRGLTALSAFVTNNQKLIASIINRQPNARISMADLKPLLVQLESMKLIPFGVSAKTVAEIVPRICELMSASGQSLGGQLDQQCLNLVVREYRHWQKRQAWIAGPMVAPNEINTERFGRSVMTAEERADCSDVGFCNLIVQSKLLYQPNDMRAHLIFYEREQFFLTERRFNRFRLSMLNLLDFAMRFVDLGYSDTKTGDSLGLTDRQFQKFYEDFKDLGVDLKILDPRSYRAGLRSFMEANLFTYTGNGINDPNFQNPSEHLMTRVEGIELLGLLATGGLVRADVYERLINLCPNSEASGETGVFGKWMIDRNCFTGSFREVFIEALGNAPHLRSLLSDLPERDVIELAYTLQETALEPWTRATDIQYAELATIIMIMLYSEVIHQVFDRDQNLVLDTEEVFNAYPRFRGLFKRFKDHPDDIFFSQDLPHIRGAKDENQGASPREALRYIRWIYSSVSATFGFFYRGSADWIEDRALRTTFAFLLKNGYLPERRVSVVSSFMYRSLLGWHFDLNRKDLIKVFATVLGALNSNLESELPPQEATAFEGTER